VLAPLDGRPLLQYVLDALAAAGLDEVIVVTGGPSADEVDGTIRWRTERRIRNPNPERGLASSVREGIAALPPDADAALVALGDQPLLRADVIERIRRAWETGSGAIVAPRYRDSGTLNPVLLARAAWPLAATLEGDRGMGPLIHASPDLVTRVDVEGDNPDIDTPDDLTRLAATRQRGDPRGEGPE
jgi:molybdenum cofactor cytidylyltransferase